MEWSSGPWQWHLTDGMGRAVNEKNMLKWYKKRCDHHVTSAGQRKISKSPTGIELGPSAHWLDALTTELQRPHGKLPHVQG